MMTIIKFLTTGEPCFLFKKGFSNTRNVGTLKPVKYAVIGLVLGFKRLAITASGIHIHYTSSGLGSMTLKSESKKKEKITV